MEDIIIKAENIWYSYDDGNSYSLNGMSVNIYKGEKVAFMGANGSGKSTFFLCCNGVNRPDKGTLYYNGNKVVYNRKGMLDLRQKVGIVFQDPDNQLFSASVYQEISFGIMNLGIEEEKAKEEVENVIRRLEITPFRNQPAHALSGGQKKQVSIADILVMHPEVMILDEPSAALDPKHSEMVNQIVDQLIHENITVMVSTHDVDYAMEWADRIVLMHEGKVLQEGTPEQVFSDVETLKKTNLRQPVVMELFQSLCRKKILSSGLPVPHSLRELETYIEKIK